jgi:hypothetical protein
MLWHDVLLIILVVAVASLPAFIWNAFWGWYATRNKPPERELMMADFKRTLPRAIGSLVIGIVLLVLLWVDTTTTNRIEDDRQRRLVDAVTKQTEAVTKQTETFTAFIERMDILLQRMSGQNGDNTTQSK